MNGLWGWMIWNEVRRNGRGPSGLFGIILIIIVIAIIHYVAVGGEYLGLWHR